MPVVPAGAEAGGEDALAVDDGDAAGVSCFAFAGLLAGAGDVLFAAVDFVAVDEVSAAAYHSLTPLCPWHAPFLLAAEDHEPSLQSPVVPAGAVAGACANAAPQAMKPNVVTIDKSSVFTSFPPSSE